MNPRTACIVIASVAGFLSVVAGVILFGAGNAPDRDEAYAIPRLDPMTFEEAVDEFYHLAPALLLIVYDAFGRTSESEIYDTLAIVTDGQALEELYLERVGAMAGGGLKEADQLIHEIKLLNSTVRSSDGALVIVATWQVIGTVGHAEHLHIRGNTYSADLKIAPIGRSWKITDFELLDVNRDAAGETFQAPQTN